MTPDAAADSPGEASKQIPTTAGMTTKVVKGSMWTLAGQVAPLMVSLVTTPFVIRMLGAEGYGVFILIGLIPTYLGFADFGMSMASTKFASEAYAEGDEEKEARIVRTAACIALMSSVPVAVALMIFAGVIIDLFNVPPAYIAEATLALRLAAVTFVINILCGIFNTPQLARLRMDLNTFINAGSRILGLVLAPVALYLGYGIIGAVSVLLAAGLMNLIGHVFVSVALLKFLLAWTIDKTRIPELARFGGTLVISLVAGLALVHGEKGVLAATVSTSALAHYSVAFTLASMITLFSSSMIQSMIPAISQMKLESDTKELSKLFSRGVRWSFLAIVPASFILVLIARDFFQIWAGDEFARQSTVPFYVLVLGLIVNLPAYTPHATILAFGGADKLAKIYWLEIPPFLFIVGLLAWYFGATGAALAWSLRVAIDGVIQYKVGKRISGVTFAIKNIGDYLILILILAVPAVLSIYSVALNTGTIVLSTISLLVYFVFGWKRLIRPDEKAIVKAKLTHSLA